MGYEQCRENKMKIRRMFLLLVIATIVAPVLTTSAPKAAHAGSNGQQLRIFVCEILGSRPDVSNSSFYVEVRGKNQRGQSVLWKSDWNGKYWRQPDCMIRTTNWWWVGDVTVNAYRKYNGTKFSKPERVNVPKSQWHNEVDVKINWK
jgi:hypothetical protein